MIGSCHLDQICNAAQTPVFSDMPTSVAVHKKGEKSIIVKSTGNEMMTSHNDMMT